MGTYSPDSKGLALALKDHFDSYGDDGDSMIKDVAKYGCVGGVSGFIYSSELAEFFDEHEEGIEELLDELNLQLNDLVADPESWSFQEVKEKAVWIAVEEFCYSCVEDSLYSEMA